jgi:hypothetical protein
VGKVLCKFVLQVLCPPLQIVRGQRRGTQFEAATSESSKEEGPVFVLPPFLLANLALKLLKQDTELRALRIRDEQRMYVHFAATYMNLIGGV